MPDFIVERAGIGGNIGPAFIDDADDPDRHAHPRDPHAIGPRPFLHHRPDRIGKRGNILQPLGHRFDALRRRA